MTAHTKKDAPVDFNPFRELTKTFEQFKMPSVDSAAFVAARRKDVEALMAANKVTYDALQALARTQTDMLTHAMQSMQESTEGGLRPAERAAARPNRRSGSRGLAEDARRHQGACRAGAQVAGAGHGRSDRDSDREHEGHQEPGAHQVGIRRVTQPGA